jgi:hypothetical protein
MFSSIFAVLAIFVGVYASRMEPAPNFEKEQDHMMIKLKNQLPKGTKAMSTMNFGVAKFEVKSEVKSWWNKIFQLSAIAFCVILLNELLSSDHFGSYVMQDMFYNPTNASGNYPIVVKEQMIAFLSSVNSMFLFAGVMFSAYYLIPNLGFSNTIKTGLTLIALYSAIGALNMFDANLHSPVLMFVTYGLLGAGFGICYYSIVAFLILLQIAGPREIKPKVSGLGI